MKRVWQTLEVQTEPGRSPAKKVNRINNQYKTNVHREITILQCLTPNLQKKNVQNTSWNILRQPTTLPDEFKIPSCVFYFQAQFFSKISKMGQMCTLCSMWFLQLDASNHPLTGELIENKGVICSNPINLLYTTMCPCGKAHVSNKKTT